MLLTWFSSPYGLVQLSNVVLVFFKHTRAGIPSKDRVQIRESTEHLRKHVTPRMCIHARPPKNLDSPQTKSQIAHFESVPNLARGRR